RANDARCHDAGEPRSHRARPCRVITDAAHLSRRARRRASAYRCGLFALSTAPIPRGFRMGRSVRGFCRSLWTDVAALSAILGQALAGEVLIVQRNNQVPNQVDKAVLARSAGGTAVPIRCAV